ncbi:MAG: PPOX class F420-dependent oxidoreductase [Acidimicrobiales bacterium]
MLEQTVKELAEGKNFATVTSLAADGSPQTHVVWVDTDGEHLVFNTEVERQKYKNLKRDPTVDVVVMDAEDPYRYVEVRGRVVDEVRGEEARAHLDELAQKYTGGPYRNPIGSERVLLKIVPDHQRAQAA